MNTTDWIGFTGVFLILLAYLLNLAGRLNHTDIRFILLNVIGAGLACAASIMLNYIPFIILEGAWTLASLAALLRFKGPSN
jgi:hypothetical protein